MEARATVEPSNGHLEPHRWGWDSMGRIGDVVVLRRTKIRARIVDIVDRNGKTYVLLQWLDPLVVPSLTWEPADNVQVVDVPLGEGR